MDFFFFKYNKYKYIMANSCGILHNYFFTSEPFLSGGLSIDTMKSIY